MGLSHYIKLSMVCLTFCLTAENVANAADVYTFSVVPQYNVVQLHTEWTPVLQRISRETGVKFELVLSSSAPKFERALLKGEPDFSLANPYHAVTAKKAQGYIPLLRNANALNGILVVRRDGPYKKIEDLQGKDVGFPAPNAFGASLYIRATLAEKNIQIQPQILNTHGNVYRSILNGGVAAGGGVNHTLNDEPAEVRDQLRVLYQTPGAASHPLLVHPRVPEAVSKAVTMAILAMKKDAAGAAMLKDVRLAQPVLTNYETDYLPLEKLGVEKFVIVEKE